MKKIVLIILICFSLFCILAFLSTYFDPNRELILNEIKAMFKPTVEYELEVNIEEIEYVLIIGAIDSPHPDIGRSEYIDKQKIKKIIQYFNDLSLVEANKDELPNMSADAFVEFYDHNDKPIGGVAMYGQDFVEIKHELYRSKTSVIKGLENIDFN